MAELEVEVKLLDLEEFKEMICYNKRLEMLVDDRTKDVIHLEVENKKLKEELKKETEKHDKFCKICRGIDDD